MDKKAVDLGVWRWWLAALFCVPMVLPYRFLPIPNYFQDAIAYGLVAIAAAALSVFALRQRDYTVPIAAVAWMPLLLGAVLVVQQLTGKISYIQHFVLPFGALLLAAIAATLAYRRFAPDLEAVFTVIATALIVAGLLNAGFGLFQLAGFEIKGFDLVERVPGPFRVAGLIAQPNQLAVLLLWSLLGVLYLWLRGRLGVVAALLIAIPFMLMLAFSASRATYVYLIVVAPALAFALRRLQVKQWWLPLAFAVAYPLLDVAVRTILPIADPTTASQVVRPIDGASAAVRLGFIRDGWQLFLSSPLLGVGWHQFVVARWAMADATPLELHADHAHNIVINLLAEVGLLGFAVVLAGTALWIWRVFSVRLTVERLIAFAMVAVVGLYSLFEFPLWFGHFLLPVAVLMGLLETRHASFVVTRGLAFLKTAAAAALVCIVGLLSIDYARVEGVYRVYFGPETADRPSMESVLALSNATLFREEAEQIYLLAAPIDSFNATFNGQMSERVFAGFPAPQFAVVRAAHVLYAGEEAKAAHILGRTCQWMPSSCDEMRERFVWLAEKNGEPIAAFVGGRMKTVLPIAATTTPQ